MKYYKVIDIRTPEEWGDKAWEDYFEDENVKCITWNNNPETFIEEFEDYPEGSEVLLVCRSANRTEDLIRAIGDTHVVLISQEGGYDQFSGNIRELEDISDIPDCGVLLFGWAGCGPCAEMKTRIKDFAIFVDCGKYKDIARDFDIVDLPTIIKLEMGKEVKRWVGLVDRSEIFK